MRYLTPGHSYEFVSGHVLFCCFTLIFSFFYLISFQIYLFVSLSVCLLVAMLMSISTFSSKHTATGATVRFAFIPTNYSPSMTP